MSSESLKKSKMLLIDVGPIVHHKIRTYALKRNITARQYVLKAILRAFAEEERYEENNAE